MARFIDLQAAEKALINADRAASAGNEQAAQEARILAQTIKAERERRASVAPVESNMGGRAPSFTEVQPEIDSLGDVGRRIGAAARIAGQRLTSFDQDRLMNTIEKSYPGTQFEMDQEGNVIVDFTPIGGGRGYLNPPGLDQDDAQQAALTAVQFGPAGRVASGFGNLTGRSLGRAGQLAGEAVAGAATAGGTEALRDIASQTLGGTDEVSAENIDSGTVGLTAAFGGAAPFIASAASAMFRRLFPGMAKPNAAIMNDDGTLTDEVIQALDDAGRPTSEISQTLRRELQQQGVLTPEQAQRFNLFRKTTGVNPTRAQITQTADDFQAQQEAMKVSGPVRELVEQQDDALTQRLAQAADEAGGTSTGPLDTGEQVFGAVSKVFDDADAEIGRLYESARQAAGDESVVAMRNLAQTLQRYRGEDTLSGGVVNAVRSEAQRLGILNKNGSLAGRQGLGLDGNRKFFEKKLTPSQAEGMRQYLNKLYEGANGRGRMLIHEMKQALDEDVFSAVGGDIYEQARGAARAKNRLLEIAKRSRHDKSTQSVIENILEGKIRTEGTLEALVINKSADVRNLQAVKSFMKTTAGEQGEQAWNSLRTDTINYLLKEATKGGKTEAGAGTFSAARFQSAVNRLGMDKLRVLFGDKELSNLMRIKQTADMRTPVSGTQQGLGPSAQAVATLIEGIPGINRVKAMSGVFERAKMADPVRETANAFNRASAAAGGAERAQAAQGARLIYEQPAN